MAESNHRKIHQVLAQFVEAWNARDADAFPNLYTDPHVDSRNARQRLRLFASRGAITISSVGHREHLKYIEVLRRDDGQWRVHWGIDAPRKGDA